MQRIYIFGSSGVGKSTLGKNLSVALKIPHIELDAIHHQANWQPLDSDEFRRRVSEVVQQDMWIIDGAYSTVRELVLSRADTIIFLDYSRSRIAFQILKRTFTRILLRTELWNGNRERWRNFFSLDPEKSVLLWSLTNFQKRRTQSFEIESNLSLPANIRLRFKHPRETKTWLESINALHQN